jgi:hypothetical protein
MGKTADEIKAIKERLKQLESEEKKDSLEQLSDLFDKFKDAYETVKSLRDVINNKMAEIRAGEQEGKEDEDDDDDDFDDDEDETVYVDYFENFSSEVASFIDQHKGDSSKDKYSNGSFFGDYHIV